jgi:asparagine synthase (glutamine-hydrolysing)
MCGIAGTYNWGDKETVGRMTQVQFHRGPDDGGVWERRLPDGTQICLGSRRLAIIDLSPAGHMPMANDNETVWITYNGEVYNFQELRRQLEARGHRFRSRSDTEVILRLYEEEGPDCVKRLNGIFGLAICDLRSATPTLFLARDHFGIKPLYYVHRGDRLAFGSEVKALLEIPDIKPELDPLALQQYLTFLWVPDPKTVFRGVEKLAAGHYAIFRNGELKITQYWDVSFPAHDAEYRMPEAEMVDGIRQHLQRSVKEQMVSDVPLGAFLSAGLDSSSIVAMMRRSTSEAVKTYTITFPPKYRIGEMLDDPAVASRFAKSQGCDHHEIVVEPQVADLLPKLVWHMDEPTADPSVITAYLVCREARKTVTVLLSGVGGDEIFAGYKKHYAHRWNNAYRKVPSGLRHLGEKAIFAAPSLRGSRAKAVVRLAKKMAKSASLSAEDAFLMNCTFLDSASIGELATPDLWSQIEAADPWLPHREHFRTAHDADFLNQLLYLDTKTYMVSLCLMYNDKMSMASSVEARVPFLDRELVEFAARNIPPRLKVHGHFVPTTKYIFRTAMKGILPEELLHQPKAGFGAPVDYWLTHDLREMTDDLLSESQVVQRGLFRPAAVKRLLDEQRSGREDWSMQIWQLLTLELWFQTFVDSAKNRQPVFASPAVR